MTGNLNPVFEVTHQDISILLKTFIPACGTSDPTHSLRPAALRLRNVLAAGAAAKMPTIRTVLANTATQDWEMEHIDVKSA
jgi:hypothetical protein